MLENDLNFLKIKLNILKIALPILSLLVTVWYISTTEDKNPVIATILLIIFTGGCSAYMIFKCNAERRILDSYLMALKSKQFDGALHYGRMYYGIKRNGINGASGAGLTVYDEQAINNDITAYSNI